MDPVSAITKGNAVLDGATSLADNIAGTAASSMAGGPYGAAAVAAQLIVDELPQGQVTKAMNAYLAIGQSALEGMAVGAAVGSLLDEFTFGLGSAVGAEVGAVIGGGVKAFQEILPWIEKDHFNPLQILGDVVNVAENAIGSLNPFSSGRPPQPDFRNLADKECFPAVSGNAPWGLTPGVWMHTPRANPQSTFYQTPNGPNQAWSLRFNFLVGWTNPIKANAHVRALAWALAQYYTEAFSARLGHKTSLRWSAVAALFPSQQEAQAAYRRMIRWYGDPNTFRSDMPFAPNGTATKSGDPGWAVAAFAEYVNKPLDYLYYPVFTTWDGSSQIDRPATIPRGVAAATSNANGVYMVPDTLTISLAELAVMRASDLQAFHFAVRMGFTWARAVKVEYANAQKAGAPIPQITTNHPNFVRVIGITSELVRNRADNRKRANMKATASLETSRKSGHKLWWLVLGGLGIGGWVLARKSKP